MGYFKSSFLLIIFWFIFSPNSHFVTHLHSANISKNSFCEFGKITKLIVDRKKNSFFTKLNTSDETYQFEYEVESSKQSDVTLFQFLLAAYATNAYVGIECKELEKHITGILLLHGQI